MQIRRFKKWFQVVNNDGFTVAQFLNEQEAKAFLRNSGRLSTFSVCQRYLEPKIYKTFRL